MKITKETAAQVWYDAVSVGVQGGYSSEQDNDDAIEIIYNALVSAFDGDIKVFVPQKNEEGKVVWKEEFWGNAIGRGLDDRLK